MPPLNWNAIRDFEDVILQELGQTVQRIPVTQTVDANGRVTDITEGTTVSITAAAVEVQPIHKEWLESGLLKVGDAVFYMKESETIKQFDVLVWNSIRYVVRDISRPPRVGDVNFAFIEIKAHREAGGGSNTTGALA